MSNCQKTTKNVVDFLLLNEKTSQNPSSFCLTVSYALC